MNFLNSRSELIADDLRQQILRGEIASPLPDTRTWSARLGTSRTNLTAALRILEKEGLLLIRGRKGVSLKPIRSKQIGASPLIKTVRFVYYGKDFPALPYTLFWLGALVERLSSQGIHFILERCSEKRLREIGSLGEKKTNRELLLLFSLSDAHQKLFANFKSSALEVGAQERRGPLSSVGSDVRGAVRHATQTMLRQGFTTISLILPKVSTISSAIAEASFDEACSTWPHQPIACETVRVSLQFDELVSSARRFSSRIKASQAVIVLHPVPVATIASALQEKGGVQDRSFRFVAVLTSPEAVKICPPPIHYPYPADGLIKTVSNAALHFFNAGSLPKFHKTIPVRRIDGIE